MALWSRDEIRVVIRYNFLRGLTIDECSNEMTEILKEECPHKTTIYRWYQEFKQGKFSVEDSTRSGRPADVTTPKNIAKVNELLTEDRHITYRQIQEVLNISAPSVHKILHECLKVRKVCTLCVPHSLTEEQKTCRVNWCKKMLNTYKNGTSNYVNSIVTGDETWLYYYDVPTKSKSKVWLFEDEPTEVQVRKSRSVKKRMIAVFFTKKGILARIVLESQRTVTSKWYTQTCLPEVIEKLKQLRPRSRLNTWHFHHDNAPAHRSHDTTEFLKNSGLKVIDHPLYSPDLAPCDFGLFPVIKEKMKGRMGSSLC